MNGFGFIEYDDPMDARDVVPGEFSFPGDGDRDVHTLSVLRLDAGSCWLWTSDHLSDLEHKLTDLNSFP